VRAHAGLPAAERHQSGRDQLDGLRLETGGGVELGEERGDAFVPEIGELLEDRRQFGLRLDLACRIRPVHEERQPPIAPFATILVEELAVS
jgi:hypothetical protein